MTFRHPISANVNTCLIPVNPLGCAVHGKMTQGVHKQVFYLCMPLACTGKCFYSKFWLTHVHFWVTDTPVLDFWWRLLWVSKPEWAALFALGIGTQCIAYWIMLCYVYWKMMNNEIVFNIVKSAHTTTWSITRDLRPRVRESPFAGTRNLFV